MIILFLKRAKHHCNTCCHFAYCPARKCDIAVGWRLHFSTQCDKKEGERYNNYLILHNIIPEQYFTGNFSFSFNLVLHLSHVACTAQKMKFSDYKILNFVLFTEEVFNGKLQFLCSAIDIHGKIHDTES